MLQESTPRGVKEFRPGAKRGYGKKTASRAEIVVIRNLRGLQDLVGRVSGKMGTFFGLEDEGPGTQRRPTSGGISKALSAEDAKEKNREVKMRYNPLLHYRRSIRLKGYDYAEAGEYFLTFCTQGRACLFGSIENELVKLSDFGEIVKEEWQRTALLRPDVALDEFIIMPNHFHGIMGLCRGTSHASPDER